MEQNFSPVSKLVLSFVEIGSLVEATGPLDQLVIGWLFLDILGGSKVSVVELLFPALHLIDAKIDKINRYERLNESYMNLIRDKY